MIATVNNNTLPLTFILNYYEAQCETQLWCAEKNDKHKRFTVKMISELFKYVYLTSSAQWNLYIQTGMGNEHRTNIVSSYS